MTHKDLDVWKRSIELVVQLYPLIQSITSEDKYSFSDKIRRFSRRTISC